MKKILILLLLLPVFCKAQNDSILPERRINGVMKYPEDSLWRSNMPVIQGRDSTVEERLVALNDKLIALCKKMNEEIELLEWKLIDCKGVLHEEIKKNK